MKSLAINFILLLGTYHASIGQSSSKIENEIDDVIEKLNLAYKELDGAKISSFFIDDDSFKSISQGFTATREDFEIISPAFFASQTNKEKKFTTKNDYNKWALQSLTTYFFPSTSWTNKDIHVFNSKSAVAVCTLSSKSKNDDGELYEIKSIETIVLKKVKRKWLIVTMHSSPLRENRTF